jgi:hypothetical protein
LSEFVGLELYSDMYVCTCIHKFHSCLDFPSCLIPRYYLKCTSNYFNSLEYDFLHYKIVPLHFFLSLIFFHDFHTKIYLSWCIQKIRRSCLKKLFIKCMEKCARHAQC